jgi:hypothetical protein
MTPKLPMIKTNDENEERNWFIGVRLQLFSDLSNESKFAESFFYDAFEFEY